MCTVDPEGKWKWYLKSEYGAITMVNLLGLGFSLSGVQTRHALTPFRLALRRARHRLARLSSRGSVGEPLSNAESRLRREVKEMGSGSSTSERCRGSGATSATTSARGGARAGRQPTDDSDSTDEESAADDEDEDAAAAALSEPGTEWCSEALLERWARRQLTAYYRAQRRRARRQRRGGRPPAAQRAAKLEAASEAESSARTALSTDGGEIDSSRPSLRPLLAHTIAPGIASIPVAEMERELIQQLLNEFHELVAITHAEAVDVKLLNLFIAQAQLLREHRLHARDEAPATYDLSADETNAYGSATDNIDDVFVLASTDSTYKSNVLEHKPVSVTYGSAVRLTSLLSEVLAWESFKLSANEQARRGGSAGPAMAARGSRCRSHAEPGKAVEADCVALMLPNSVEYNLIWWAVARAGPLKTFLLELYDGPSFSETISESLPLDEEAAAVLRERSLACRAASRAGHWAGSVARTLRNVTLWPFVRASAATSADAREPPGAASTPTYRPCRTALINTNITSNAMLYHALACSGCSVAILDAQFVPLLFLAEDNGDGDHDDGNSSNNSASAAAPLAEAQRLRLHVPPALQRIYLWRWTGVCAAQGITEHMKELLDDFNASAYAQLPAALSDAVDASVADDETDNAGDRPERPGQASAQRSAPLPPLDLYALVKDEYEAPCADERMAGGHYPRLLASVLQHPPRWLHCEPQTWIRRPSPRRAGRGDSDHPIPRRRSRQPAAATAETTSSAASSRSGSSTQSGVRSATVAQTLFARLYVHSITTAITKTRELAVARGEPLASAASAASATSPTSPTGGSARRARARGLALETQLRQQQRQFNARLAAALSRFVPTQPVLFIYTSGTTGLPKAARFSHLRFFATAFLSKVLAMRVKTREVVTAQKAARRRFDTALQATASGRHGATVTAHSDAVKHRPRRAWDVIVLLSWQFLVLCVRLVLALLGVLPYVEAARYAVAARWYRLCGWADAWRQWETDEVATEEELARISIYNCLPMYHTIGCVFCLGHLMHALEEQQGAARGQASLAARAHCGKSVFASASLSSCACRPPSARMVIRTKFSASKFVADMQRYHVTVAQYIGEVLRYAVLYERDHAPTVAECAELLQHRAQSLCPATLVAKDVSSLVLPDGTREKEVMHLVNLLSRWQVPYAFGNGLRLDIWQESKDRLAISQPVEFYSSTEGNIFLFNLFDLPGVVGHIPRFPGLLNRILDMNRFPIFPFRVLRYDEDTQQVWRDPKTNFCRLAGVGESGEAVGEIIQGFDMFALRRFDGYHQNSSSSSDKKKEEKEKEASVAVPDTAAPAADAESQKKILHHVIWPYASDAYFRSGDLVKYDDTGFVYFVDRVGETFRWKGENVSTLEVSNALSTIHTTRIGVQEAVVYGVTVPGREGRAGMALLTLQRRFLGEADEGERGAEAAAAAASASRQRRPSLQEERLFLQNDLYGFLCGRRQRNGDGSLAESALPAYAMPLFLRVEDPQDDEDDHDVAKCTEASASPGSPLTPASPLSPSAASHQEEQLRTTTFKYRKSVLTKQGYAQAPPSTIAQTSVWGDGDLPALKDTDASAPADAVSAPASRFYVLVRKPDVWRALSREPRSPATVQAGYVPLTAAAVALIGEHFDGCGW